MFQGLGFALLKYKEVLKSTRSWINRPDLLKYQVRSPALSLAVLSSSKKRESYQSIQNTFNCSISTWHDDVFICTFISWIISFAFYGNATKINAFGKLVKKYIWSCVFSFIICIFRVYPLGWSSAMFNSWRGLLDSLFVLWPCSMFNTGYL